MIEFAGFTEFMSPEEQAEHDRLKRKRMLGTMIKEQKIEGVGLLKGLIKLTNKVMEVEMPVSLYKEFKDWFEYNFPGLGLTPFQEALMEKLLEEGIPVTKKELAKRLEELLPGKSK